MTSLKIKKPKPKENAYKLDAVFEGGGVKGNALVGAVAYAQSLGYTFVNVAGTSAGAIMASLLAAGYTAEEIKTILDKVDYHKFKDKSTLGSIPVLGDGLDLLFHEGLYRGSFFENWLRNLLAQKGVHTFGDLLLEEYKNEPRYRYKLQVVASDITRGRLLFLPNDIAEYGIHPDRLDVATAVRMSMSIPYFFEPFILKHHPRQKTYIVDGGILSNFPVEIFDDSSSSPLWPTIGFKLVDPDQNKPHTITNPINLFTAMFETMLEAHDERYIKDANFVRTIPIPTLGIHTTDFTITQAQKNALYHSGYSAAEKFFSIWDFEKYKKKYRQKEPDSRTKKVWK